MSSSPRKILVTAALPYANGEIHLGHVLEYVQADIWTRFQKMRGHECRYFCADDTHGTPIMISARAQNISPEELIKGAYERHSADLADFQVEFDNFYSTHSPENKVFSEEFFLKMKKKNHIVLKTIKQAYCEHDKMFLPDRFVKGTCPKCGAEEQYGDSCDVCAATYAPGDLKDPHCSICKNPPTTRDSEHIFFKLNDYKDFLKDWLPGHTQKEINNKMLEWFGEDLRDWDISRDDPYFGFEIPGHPGKYFYVWVDAPIGYISSTKNWCDRNGRDYKEFWSNPEAEIHHFIGKDIIYFHTLFWPAMLKAAEYNLPTKVNVHGFVKINGEKMSKSKGTFINARTYLKHVDPMYLRYYYASKLSNRVDDIDLNISDFISRVNSELIGKITNLASRGAQMLNKKLDGTTSTLDDLGQEKVKWAQSKSEVIAEHFENLEYSKAIIEIRDIAEGANKYFDEHEPWKLIKTDPIKTKQILTTIINMFRIMAIYLKPVMPEYSKNVEALLNEKTPFTWNSAQEVLENRAINAYTHLATRLEQKQFDTMIQEELSKSSKA